MANQPASVKVFAIIDLILLGLGVLGAVMGMRYAMGSMLVRIIIYGVFIYGFILVLQGKNLGRILTLIYAWLGMIFCGLGVLAALLGLILGASFLSGVFAIFAQWGMAIMLVLIVVCAGFFVFFLFHVIVFNRHKSSFA